MCGTVQRPVLLPSMLACLFHQNRTLRNLQIRTAQIGEGYFRFQFRDASHLLEKPINIGFQASLHLLVCVDRTLLMQIVY